MARWQFWKKNDPKKAMKRGYAGAKFSRLTADWITASTSADSEIWGSLQKLRDRCRQLERDNDTIRNFLRITEENVVGEGIPFQAQNKMQRGSKLNDKLNDLIELKFDRWSRKEFCHTSGTLARQDIEKLSIRSVARDGEIFIRKIFRPFGGSRVPLALEILESERVDDQYNGRSESGNEIRMGVEIDEWRRPVAYYVLDRHPGDYQFSASSKKTRKHTRVPAGEIIHLFLQERAEQTRGVPWAASAVMKINHLNGYTEAEIISARATAALMGFIQTPEGQLTGDDVDDGDRVTEFEPGVFKKLGPGETVNVPNLNRPSGQYAPFYRAMMLGTAQGLGISVESLSKDYQGSSYSSARQALLEDRDHWRVIQQWMIRNFHQVVFEAWLDAAVLSGEVDIQGYWTLPEAYQSVKWMPRGWTWIDPLKEVSAMKEAIAGGLATQTQIVAQGGGDIDELMTQRKREVDRAKELGLVFDTDPANEAKKNAPQSKDESSEVTENT